jgi:hypothetical protein
MPSRWWMLRRLSLPCLHTAWLPWYLVQTVDMEKILFSVQFEARLCMPEVAVHTL